MTVLTFPGYGVNSPQQYIVASRIVNFKPIEYNGLHGTEIFLDNGTSVRVHAWPEDVIEKLSNQERL